MCGFQRETVDSHLRSQSVKKPPLTGKRIKRPTQNDTMVVLRTPSPAGMRWLVLALTLGTARAFTPRADLRFTRATTRPLVARRPACSEHNVPGFFSSIFGPLVTGTPESGRTVAEEFSHGLNESSRTFAEEFSQGLNESSRTFAEVFTHGLNESSRTFAESFTEPSRLQGSEAAKIFTRSATERQGFLRGRPQAWA